MKDRVTVPRLREMKARGEKVVCLTAYDATFGRLADDGGVDVILVGDSVGNTLLGYATTLPVTLEDMIHHTKATRAGVNRALLIADLPFGSYQTSIADAVRAAVELVRAGAEAVKLEGDYPEVIREIVRAGIPVMGHAGMTPQSTNMYGGFRVQGKGQDAALVKDVASRIDRAGAFGMVLELIPELLAKEITDSVPGVTIGIAAGPNCDGQIQVLHDVLGFTEERFRHAFRMMEGGKSITEAIRGYASCVRSDAETH